MSSPINFVLDNFHTTITLDVSGTMLGLLYTLDASADAVYQINKARVQDAFQFQSDASDVIDASGSDIKFYLDETNFWDAGFKYNPADSQMVSGSGSHGPVGSGFDANKNMVCHDFVRYIAESLFNTHHGVDLLDNELELLTDVRLKSKTVWTNMETELAKYNDLSGTGESGVTLLDDSSGKKYSTDDNSNSIVRKLYEQMINSPSGRSRFKGGYVTGLRQGLPFQIDDQIEIKLTIHPQGDQHNLTAVPALGGRAYKIIYKIVASPTNEARASNENNLHLVRV